MNKVSEYPPVEYRLLQPDEIIQRGDEFLTANSPAWREVDGSINSTVKSRTLFFGGTTFRRKVCPPLSEVEVENEGLRETVRNVERALTHANIEVEVSRATVQSLQKQLEEARKRDFSGDYHQGFNDGTVKLQGAVNRLRLAALDEVAKTMKLEKDLVEAQARAQALIERSDALRAERNEARAQRDETQHAKALAYKAGSDHTYQKGLDALKFVLCKALDFMTITGDNIGDIRRSFFTHDESWNSFVRDETAAREKRVAEAISPAPTNIHVLPGDIWRSVDGDVSQMRLVHSVEGNRVRYFSQTGKHNGDVWTKTVPQFASFVGNVSSVQRGAFSPAKHEGEPKEGFAVGDIWTKGSGASRTITSVSDKLIEYRFIEAAYNSNSTFCHVRGGICKWLDASMSGATLTRK